eukprot:2627043-Pyramimonas_sp.AAC.1
MVLAHICFLSQAVLLLPRAFDAQCAVSTNTINSSGPCPDGSSFGACGFLQCRSLRRSPAQVSAWAH